MAKVDLADRCLRGKTVVSDDRQLDIRLLAWAEEGLHALDAGEQRLAWRFHSEELNHSAIDCQVLSTLDWQPFGTDRPSEERTGGGQRLPRRARQGPGMRS